MRKWKLPTKDYHDSNLSHTASFFMWVNCWGCSVWKISYRELTKFTASAAKHNIDIIYVQEHRYYQIKLDLINHDTGNECRLCRQSSASHKYTNQNRASSIGRYRNANKTEYMCFKQKGAISTLNGKPLELVDQLTYLGSNISSTESDDNISLMKAWNAIDRLSIIKKFDLFDKIFVTWSTIQQLQMLLLRSHWTH